MIVNGTLTFWPKPLLEVDLDGGRRLLGEVTRSESYRLDPEELAKLSPAHAERVRAQDGFENRRLLRTGNFDLYGNDFRWVTDYEIAAGRPGTRPTPGSSSARSGDPSSAT